MKNIRETLEISIVELSALMERPDAVEQDFQEWFERHPITFDILGYVRSIPHPELVLDGETSIRPDFIAMRSDGLWEIVELKRPNTAVLRNPQRRTVFYSEMGTYVSQCQEYSERCSQVQAHLALFQAHGIKINSQPSCVLIAGRSMGLDRQRVHSLLKRSTVKISHHTFDDVLDALQRHYTQSYMGGGSGVSVYASLLLTASRAVSTECLFDMCESAKRNRITVTRFGTRVMTITIIDNEGMRTMQDVDLSRHCNGVGFILGIHVTHAMDSVVILLEVNGSYAAEHRLTRGNFAITHPVALVVGANVEGQHGASMLFGDFIVRDPPLNLTERWQLREHLFDKFATQLQDSPDLSIPRGVRFSGEQFLYTEGHPTLDAKHPRTTNLVQRDDTKRPIFAG
jgi:hypothetical protein